MKDFKGIGEPKHIKLLLKERDRLRADDRERLRKELEKELEDNAVAVIPQCFDVVGIIPYDSKGCFVATEVEVFHSASGKQTVFIKNNGEILNDIHGSKEN